MGSTSFSGARRIRVLRLEKTSWIQPPLIDRAVQKLSIIQTLLELRQRVTARSRESGEGTAVRPKSPVCRQTTRVWPFSPM
jgi:hypothetical protein